MSALTKADLALHLTEKLGLNQREAKELIDTFFEEIRLALDSGDDVKLSGFGNFILRDKSPRPGRNPRTGEAKEVSKRRVVTFKAGQKLRSHLDGEITDIDDNGDNDTDE